MNKSSQNHHSKLSGRESGVALIAALITLLLIAAITAGMIILSTTETNISSNFRDEQLAFFSAKAGIEEARDRMRTAAANTLRAAGTLPTTLPGSGTTGVLYILNPANGETVTPAGSNPANYADDEICKETSTVACTTGTPKYPSNGSGWFHTVTASATYAAAPVMPWKWTRITLKQNNGIAPYYTNGNSASAGYVCWNGNNEFASATPCVAPNLSVYVLTTLAVTPSGSRRMVQTEIAEDSLVFNAPSALTMDGPVTAFGGGNSGNFGVDGNDHPGCGVATTGPAVPAVAVTDPASVATVTGGIPHNRDHNYIGVDGTTPDVSNVSSTLPPNLQTVTSLQNLVTTIKNNVTQPVLNGMPTSLGGPGPVTSIPNPGTQTDPQIIVVTGDLSLSGAVTGYGILVVTGTFTASGNVGWNGLILVVGQGNFLGNGGGNNSYNGAVLVAKTLDANYNPLATVGPGTTDFNFNGGGGNGINYSSGCIANATTLSTFHVVAIRELMN